MWIPVLSAVMGKGPYASDTGIHSDCKNFLTKQIPSQIEYHIIFEIQLQTLNNKYFYKPTLFSCLSYAFVKEEITISTFTQYFGFTHDQYPVPNRFKELKIKTNLRQVLQVNITVKY